jgi:hypothetical protein
VVDEVDLYDFVLLEILQVFFPAVYQDLWRTQWVYVPGWTQEVLVHTPLTRSSDPQEKSRYIREHIEQLLVNECQKDLIKAILEELFFMQVKDAFSSYAVSNYVGVGEVYLKCCSKLCLSLITYCRISTTSAR